LVLLIRIDHENPDYIESYKAALLATADERIDENHARFLKHLEDGPPLDPDGEVHPTVIYHNAHEEAKLVALKTTRARRLTRS